MAHTNTWLIEKRVLLIEYVGDVSKNEVQQINRELEAFLREGNKPIHIISDNSQMGKAEITLKIVFESFSAMKKQGWGWVIFIGIDRIAHFFAEVFAIQFGVHMRIAASRAEALDMLKQLDMSLAADKS